MSIETELERLAELMHAAGGCHHPWKQCKVEQSLRNADSHNEHYLAMARVAFEEAKKARLEEIQSTPDMSFLLGISNEEAIHRYNKWRTDRCAALEAGKEVKS